MCAVSNSVLSFCELVSHKMRILTKKVETSLLSYPSQEARQLKLKSFKFGGRVAGTQQ